ncbi:hypothetical protein [Streptomyces murinus]|uniref:hypothetical protein n=1 Tax=Streptomyces murinus TaxID=33900 RepID=UPI003F487895
MGFLGAFPGDAVAVTDGERRIGVVDGEPDSLADGGLFAGDLWLGVARATWRTLAQRGKGLRMAEPGPARIFAMLRGRHHTRRSRSADTAAFVAHASRTMPNVMEPLLRPCSTTPACRP